MDFINRLHFQLRNLKFNFLIDYQFGKVNYEYFIEEHDCKLLEINKLRDYISTTLIVNNVFLKEIAEMANSILFLWNNYLINYPRIHTFENYKRKKSFTHSYTNLCGWYTELHPNIFFSVMLTKDDEEGDHEWIENRKYDITSVSNILFNCQEIVEIYQKAFPHDLILEDGRYCFEGSQLNDRRVKLEENSNYLEDIKKLNLPKKNSYISKGEIINFPKIFSRFEAYSVFLSYHVRHKNLINPTSN